MKQLRAGIIGCGGISRAHVHALKQETRAVITAVCDIDPERAKKAAQDTGAQVINDWRALIASGEVDVVHLCTPHYLHAPMAIEALGAGLHVLSEKPMATTARDARAMIEAADKSSGQLGIIFQLRYGAAIQTAKAMMDSGELGAFLAARASLVWSREAPYYLDSGWRGTKMMEGAGLLINQAIHTLDLLSYIGGPIAATRGAVYTGMLEDLIEVEDNASAVAVYEGGQRALFSGTLNYVRNTPIEIEFACERGALRLVGDVLSVKNDDGETLVDVSGASGLARWGAGHVGQIRHFYHCLAGGERYPIDGRAGWPALDWVLSILRSCEERRFVHLDKEVML